MDVAKEALQITLMFGRSLMLRLFEGGIANEDLALLAPKLGLCRSQC